MIAENKSIENPEIDAYFQGLFAKKMNDNPKV